VRSRSARSADHPGPVDQCRTGRASRRPASRSATGGVRDVDREIRHLRPGLRSGRASRATSAARKPAEHSGDRLRRRRRPRVVGDRPLDGLVGRPCSHRLRAGRLRRAAVRTSVAGRPGQRTATSAVTRAGAAGTVTRRSSGRGLLPADGSGQFRVTRGSARFPTSAPRSTNSSASAVAAAAGGRRRRKRPGDRLRRSPATRGGRLDCPGQPRRRVASAGRSASPNARQPGDGRDQRGPALPGRCRSSARRAAPSGIRLVHRDPAELGRAVHQGGREPLRLGLRRVGPRKPLHREPLLSSLRDQFLGERLVAATNHTRADGQRQPRPGWFG